MSEPISLRCVQLRKALEADPAFRAKLAALVQEIKAKGGEQTQCCHADRGLGQVIKVKSPLA